MTYVRTLGVLTLALTLSSSVQASDCNVNGVDDAEDLANGTLTDCNNNGVPDFCENTYKTDFTTAATGEPFSIQSAELTGDTHRDLAYVDRAGNSVVVLVGDGAGGFTPVSFPVGASPQSLAIADFNHDGHPDLAVANSVGDTISILLNAGITGQAAFNAGPTLDAGLAPIFIIATDLDADGDQDLAIANAGDQTIRLFLNNGSAVFTAVVPDKDAKGAPFSMIAAKLDADNRPDLAIANEESDNLSIILSGGAVLPPTAGNFSGPAAVASADFDEDGLQDLAVANYKSSKVLILRNVGGGVLSPGQEITDVTNPFYLIAKDVNGDGHQDLIVTGSSGSGQDSQSSATLLMGDGHGNFLANAHSDFPGVSIDSFVYGTFVSANGPQVAALDTAGKQVLFLSLQGPECSKPSTGGCGACGSGGATMVPLTLAGMLLMRTGSSGGSKRRSWFNSQD